jgi:hypothetical protein
MDTAPQVASSPPSQQLAWAVENLPEYEQMAIRIPLDRLHPKTTLTAKRIEGSVVLTRADSPYLVTGMLLVADHATLTIEPGTIMLFSPQVKLQIDGTLNAVSGGQWIVLTAADPKQRWAGVVSHGKMRLQECLIANAQVAVSEPQGTLSAEKCIFSDSGIAMDIGNNGSGTARNCLFLHNDLGVIGHGDAGTVRFSQCLLLFNKRGCTTNFYGKCVCSNCTFYGNETAIEAAERGNGVRINLSNVITTTGRPLGSRGGKVMAAGNYWGKQGAPTEPNHEISGALTAAVKDAMPDLPSCEYLWPATSRVR